jgi:ketosteroid isomerase-like protein
MKVFTVAIIIFVAFAATFAQSDVQKLVNTEQAFAKTAAERGTKAAFLAFMASDAVVFTPDKTGAVEYWKARNDSPSRLIWSPNFADISANGIIGYTTGNWELRPKGIDDAPSAFGDFVTVWVRQPSGEYKWVVDMGAGHERPERYSTDWSTDKGPKDLNAKNSSAADAANGFFSVLAEQGIARAYEAYGVETMRGYREGKKPFLGRKSFTSFLKSDKGKYALSKRSTFFGSADLAYALNTYTKTVDGTTAEKGNTLQIWKLVGGRWRIVLDVFKPLP